MTDKQLIEALEQWCKEHRCTLTAAAENGKGETIPIAFFLPPGIEPAIQIVMLPSAQGATCD